MAVLPLVRPSPAGGPGYHLGRRQTLDRAHIGTAHQKPPGPHGADHPEIAKILAELPGEVGRLFPWTPDAVSHHFAKTARRAKVKARLHDLRHTYASHLLMSGAQLPVVHKLLGHKDIEATQIYAHLNQDLLDEALLKLDFAPSLHPGK